MIDTKKKQLRTAVTHLLSLLMWLSLFLLQTIKQIHIFTHSSEIKKTRTKSRTIPSTVEVNEV
jgi:hypothetical protein